MFKIQLRLFLLPCLLSLAEARKGRGFRKLFKLFIGEGIGEGCIGEGCSGWNYVLMFLSILFTICCCLLLAACRCLSAVCCRKRVLSQVECCHKLRGIEDEDDQNQTTDINLVEVLNSQRDEEEEVKGNQEAANVHLTDVSKHPSIPLSSSPALIKCCWKSSKYQNLLTSWHLEILGAGPVKKTSCSKDK